MALICKIIPNNLYYWGFFIMFAPKLKQFNIMGQLSEQLKEYLDNATPEQLEEDWFKVQCVIRGINPELPDADKQLKKLIRKEKWECRIPSIRLGIDVITTSILYMASGTALSEGYFGLFVVNLFLGSYFMHKTLKDSRRIW